MPVDCSTMESESTTKVSVYYEESHPEGPADFSLLLLHGREQCSQVWTLGGVMASLASHGHRTVAIDLPGAGKTKIIESLNGLPSRERYPILIQSIIQEFNLERVILVACDFSATYVLDYLDKNNNEGSDVVGCILCKPDLTEAEEVEFETTSDVPILILSEETDSQIILSPQSLHEITTRPAISSIPSSDLWPVKRPREFVEKILVFLSRLQTTEV